MPVDALQPSMMAPITAEAVGHMMLRLALSVVLGWLVARVYRLTHSGEPFAATFPQTLVLLCILICAVTQVIGDNVARAFSLVGALSIVRFRTVVQDTRDTAFVIFAVIEGMAAGANQLWLAVLGFLAVTLAAWLVGGPPGDAKASAAEAVYVLGVRIQLGLSPDDLLPPVFTSSLAEHTSTSVATARQGAWLECGYRVKLKPEVTPAALVDQLDRVDGVLGVELRREAGA